MTEHKRALVTGGAQRLGRTIAVELARCGHDVAIHYHTAAALAQETRALVEAEGRRAVTLQADLTRESAMQALVPSAAEALGGPLTALVNNASIFEPDEIASATRASWDRHLESNLRAPFVLTQAFAAQAPRAAIVDGEPQARACVINMIDQRVWSLTPKFMSYTIAKSALWTLTRTAAQALAPDIRVNGIGPGPTLAHPRQSSAHFTAQREGILLKRAADPVDIAAGVRFLLEARSMTGQMIALDGGQHLGWETPDIIGRRR